MKQVRSQSEETLTAGKSLPTAASLLSQTTRLLKVRQWLGMGVPTDASAPQKTGLQDRWGFRPGHCLPCTDKASRNPKGVSHPGAAAQEPTLYQNLPTPIILSATVVTDHRKSLPGLLLSGGEFFRGSLLMSLRPARTIPPVQSHKLFRGTHLALPGIAGVDTKTGAAIQRPVIPGES